MARFDRFLTECRVDRDRLVNLHKMADWSQGLQVLEYLPSTHSIEQLRTTLGGRWGTLDAMLEVCAQNASNGSGDAYGIIPLRSVMADWVSHLHLVANNLTKAQLRLQILSAIP